MEKKEKILRQLRTDKVLNKKVLDDLEQKVRKASILDNQREVEELLDSANKLLNAWEQNLKSQKKINGILNEIEICLELIQEYRKRWREYDII
jgi:hypothetical protein